MTANLEMRIGVTGREQAVQDFSATRAAAEAMNRGVATAAGASSRAQDALAGANSRARQAVEAGTRSTIQATRELGRYSSETSAAARANTQFAATARSQMGAVDGLQQSMSGLKALYGSMAAIAGGMLVKSFLDAGSEVEDLTVQFKVLLGSVEDAKERIEEYSDFSAKTPFELGEIARAGRVLQVFGGQLLSTGDNLRMVGDIAAGTNSPFQDTAMWIGRMYDALQSGRPWGEAGARLQDMGALSGEARAQLEDMQEQGESGAAIWAAFSDEMGRFNGMMDDLARTRSGQWSTSMDLIKEGIREVLAGGAWDTLNQGLSDFNALIQQLIESGALREAGEHINVILVVLRDLAAFWAGNKIALGVTAFAASIRAQSAAAAAGVAANRAYSLSLGPIAAAAIAAQLAIDALIASKEREANLKASTSWRDDANQLRQVRDAMLEYADAAKQAEESSPDQFDPFAAAKKQHDADAVLRSITGWGYDDLVLAQNFTKEIANARLQALNVGKRNVATEDIESLFSGGGSDTSMTEKAMEEMDKMNLAVEAANARFRENKRKALQEDARIDEERVELYRQAQARLAEASLPPGDEMAALRLKQEEELALYAEGSQARLIIEQAHAREMATLEAEQRDRWDEQSDEYRAYTTALKQMNSQVQASSFALAGSVAAAMLQSRKSAPLLFATQKAIAAASIVVNSLAAEAAAFAPPPIGAGPILGFGLAAEIKRKMFVDLGFLAATSVAEGVQRFADGGISVASGVVPGSAYYGDTVPARLNSREMVLNMGQQAELFAIANGATTRYNNSRTTNNYQIQWSPVMPQSVGTQELAWDQMRRVLEYNKVEFAAMLSALVKKGYA